MLTVLDADEVIDLVISGDDVERSKPDPQIFEVARDRGGLDPALVLAIGDAVWDVDAARAAGMGCVTVESGGFSRHELFEAGAVAVYRNVEELGAQLLTGPVGMLLAGADRASSHRDRACPTS
jgi:phosphoglycolate phosphatase-like HAD superfamily hydrolase